VLLVPAGLLAQPEAEQAPAAEPKFFQVRYEPGNKVNLPIQTCEIKSVAVPQPFTAKLPVKVKISVYSVRELKILATAFEGTLTEPKKLDPGYYAIEVEGTNEIIYVAYATPETWQLYLIHKLPGNELMGPFIIPGVARLPIGQYSLQGSRFKMDIECRNEERAVFEVPAYEGLPPFLAPAEGIAW
jgi:hypothetical protein